jgi:hypothetical protein
LGETLRFRGFATKCTLNQIEVEIEIEIISLRRFCQFPIANPSPVGSPCPTSLGKCLTDFSVACGSLRNQFAYFPKEGAFFCVNFEVWE